jgi:lysophospholipase L1-like esterase
MVSGRGALRSRSMTRRLIRSLGILAMSVVVASPSVAAAETPKFNPPKTYYLALGDSISYGYQAWRRLAGLPASGYDTGYVDVFANRLRQIQPAIQVVNYSCIGESTRTFMTGPCVGNVVGQPLHDGWSGTQLDAALAFLSAHKGEVSPITVTLGGNDARELNEECGGDLNCILERVQAAIARTAANLETILGRLRAAAPQAEIIVTGPWNISVGAFPETDPFFALFNEALKQSITDSRARYVELFPIFNPQGDIDAETAAICTLTLLCTDGDIHPSDAGYRVIADEVWDASEYERLLHEATGIPLED